MKANIFLLVVVAWLFSTPVFAQSARGKASYYADKFEGRPTASGEKYRRNKFTAAHRKLPFGTIIRVTNLENQREVIVTVNDRGPFVKGRIIDLSRAAAESLDFIMQGTADVEVEVISDGASSRYYSTSDEKIDLSGWAVQLGSFSQRSNARAFARKIGESYSMQTFIEEAIINNIPHFRVLAGPFSIEKKAQQEHRRLSKHFDKLIVREI
ncbi:MAG: septal ring lytic transglycosylase RlpA family protein [Cyclobacteriaceae bacterium]